MVEGSNFELRKMDILVYKFERSGSNVSSNLQESMRRISQAQALVQTKKLASLFLTSFLHSQVPRFIPSISSLIKWFDLEFRHDSTKVLLKRLLMNRKRSLTRARFSEIYFSRLTSNFEK